MMKIEHITRTGKKITILLDKSVGEELQKEYKIYAKYLKASGRKYYAFAYLKNVKKAPRVLLHRLILQPLVDQEVDQEVDHINGNTLDNRLQNLRIATRTENSRNRKGWSKNFPKGVKKRFNRFEARIQVNGKYVYLGSYKTVEEASQAYDMNAQKVFGAFANLNSGDSND